MSNFTRLDASFSTKDSETTDFETAVEIVEKESVVNKPQKFSGATPTISWSDVARDAPSGRCSQ